MLISPIREKSSLPTGQPSAKHVNRGILVIFVFELNNQWEAKVFDWKLHFNTTQDLCQVVPIATFFNAYKFIFIKVNFETEDSLKA